MSFLGPPRDWVERFGRHFIITSTRTCKAPRSGEILPWLRISAELDPQKIETYTVSAYWLRDLGKVKEAEAFLREGCASIRTAYEILFELGRLLLRELPRSGPGAHLWNWASAGGPNRRRRARSPTCSNWTSLP